MEDEVVILGSFGPSLTSRHLSRPLIPRADPSRPEVHAVGHAADARAHIVPRRCLLVPSAPLRLGAWPTVDVPEGGRPLQMSFDRVVAEIIRVV